MSASGTLEGSTWFLSRRLFLAGIALVFALAFASLGVQVLGLFGSAGIAPLAERMAFEHGRLAGWERLQLPTLLWFGTSDAGLVALCVAGGLAAALAMAGFLPRLALFVAWGLYLSLALVGSPFLDFQWDALLLEAGLLAVLFAPGGLRPFGRDEPAPSDAVRWSVYLLVFKLFVLSGAVKLLSGDESWRDGSALDFHYWSQPLPHRLSVTAAETSPAFKQASVLVMFTIELGLPWLLLVPVFQRRLRQLVATGVVFLMAAVTLTGNYGFFTLLASVLCVPLLDDRAWRVVFRATSSAAPPARARPAWGHALPAVLVAPLALVSLTQVSSGLGWLRSPAPIVELEEFLAPLRSVNPYGLFRVMTRTRDEIQVEGSADGRTWLPYRFRYKPDELERAPVWAAFHMPRLDWQMWFAALDNPQRLRWFWRFLERLLENEPTVTALLASNPFADKPPIYVRAQFYDYTFAGSEEKAAGQWWDRRLLGQYFPAVHLKVRPGQ